jgi:hypothetical protein
MTRLAAGDMMQRQVAGGEMKNPARLIVVVLGIVGFLAGLPVTAAVAADRDAAALFARVCMSDAPAFKRVKNNARSEGWQDAPPPRGPKPARLQAWLLPVDGRVGFLVSVSTVRTAAAVIEQCTVGGQASRQAIRAMLRSVKAEEQPSMTGDMVPGGIVGNPDVYTGQVGNRLAYITADAAQDAYVLTITIPHDR